MKKDNKISGIYTKLMVLKQEKDPKNKKDYDKYFWGKLFTDDYTHKIYPVAMSFKKYKTYQECIKYGQ